MADSNWSSYPLVSTSKRYTSDPGNAAIAELRNATDIEAIISVQTNSTQGVLLESHFPLAGYVQLLCCRLIRFG